MCLMDLATKLVRSQLQLTLDPSKQIAHFRLVGIDQYIVYVLVYELIDRC